MNKIGVNIDLSVFFEDERKLVLVMVDPKWESVECLQKRVEFLFDVDLVRFLNSDGYFLPPQEPIEIIKCCKGLKAFVPKESLEKRKKKTSKKTKKEDKSLLEFDIEEASNSNGNNEEQNNSSKIKRKYHSLQSEFSMSTTPQSAKRLKNCIAVNADSVIQINKSSEISSTSEQMPPPPLVDCKITNVKKSKSVTSKRSHNSTAKEECLSEIVDNVRSTFEEEMKARPSSIHSSTLINDSKIVDTATSKKSSHSTPNKKNPFKGKSFDNNKGGHIYFNECGKMVSTIIEKSKNTTITKNETKKPQTVTIFRCSLNDVSNQKPRIFQIKSLTKSPKNLVEIQEEIIIRPKTLDNYVNESLERTDSQQTNSSKIQTIDTLQNNINESVTGINQKDDTTTTTENTTIANSEQISMEYTDTTNSTTIAIANEHTFTENLETSETVENHSNKDDSVNNTSINNKFNESSVLSIDSVDLSIVIDVEDDGGKNKKQTQQQSLDLTQDDRDDDSSDVEEISDIIDLNETEDNCDSTVNTLPERRFRQIYVHNVLPFCKDMLDLPNVGDIIVFKVAYINKKQKSAETNFIAGIAEYINKRTKTIKLLVKDGLVELPFVPNKFFCHLNESEDQSKYLQLKLSDMLQPKFCSRS